MGRTVVSHSSETVGGSRSILVGASETKTVQNSSTVTVTDDLRQTAGRDLVLAADREIQLSGRVKMTADDPNLTVFVDGAVNLQSLPGVPSPDPLYGTLFVKNADGKLYYIDTGGAVHDLTVLSAGRCSFSAKRDTSYTWSTSSSFETIDFSSDTTEWDNTGDGFNDKNSTFVAPADGVYTFSRGNLFYRPG